MASTLITGTFTLSIENYTTVPISYNANTSEVAAALAGIGAGPVTVSRIGPDPIDGYTWIITFTPNYYNYDVPQMTYVCVCVRLLLCACVCVCVCVLPGHCVQV